MPPQQCWVIAVKQRSTSQAHRLVGYVALGRFGRPRKFVMTHEMDSNGFNEQIAYRFPTVSSAKKVMRQAVVRRWIDKSNWRHPGANFTYYVELIEMIYADDRLIPVEVVLREGLGALEELALEG